MATSARVEVLFSRARAGGSHVAGAFVFSSAEEPHCPRWGVELRILWGDRILGEHFLHAGVDRAFRMGSAAGVDFAMSAHLFDEESFDAVVSKNGAFELRFTQTVTGSLDKELVRQVVHAHRSQVRYCYESELQRKPTLAGKIGVSFVINDSGTVSVARVANTTMNNAAVETCVAGRVRTWVFPKPKGGGQVIVQYPFVFKSAGQ